jgi:hypothetical protein
VTHLEIVSELRAISDGIDAQDLRATWLAALTGWEAPAHLEGRVERLRALRDQVGHDAVARKRKPVA